MTTRVFRLFLSSPGDVGIERRRVAAVVSRLNGECAGRARIDVIRWETEAYQAHDTFQAQIPQAVECDLVLTVFKWRLGTELPPDFPDRMEGGEPYPSGTAYELLTSVEARRSGAESPDVFVYRYGGSAPRPAIDDPDRDRVEKEWRRLEAFFARWFLTPEGHFRAAFQLYASEDDFEAQIEVLLRRWLTEKVAAGRILAWPDAIKGSPYPGLESYGWRHAAVFFGRGRDVGRAVDLWRERAADGTPFLLVVGASGAGKSSLAKAGLVPRLTIPGVIEAVDHWRVAALRPGDDPEGPLAALATALLATERDLPAAEEGRGPALPELAGTFARSPHPEGLAGDRSPNAPHAEVPAAGGPRSTQDRCASFEAPLRGAPQDEDARSFRPDSQDEERREGETVGRLFRNILAAAPKEAAARIIKTLDEIGAAERDRERRERAVRVDLVLVVDQLDELFAPTVAAGAREAFVAALAALLATGRVWVAATLRADLYAALLENPGLKDLKEKGASYDLGPPGAAELAEIVRRPAEAADLAFGADPATGEGVDERLLREADRPDMLPLVQLALARLYEGRRTEAAEDGRERTVLPYDVYAGLGGLTGIIDEVGERALAGLDEPSLRSLPRLTRGLAQLEQEGALAGTLTITPRPLAEIAPDEPTRRLIAALVASRLLTLTDAGEGGLVRLAHQRILVDWTRAREIVQGSADFYRVRREIEARRQRWQAERRPDLLLPRGLPLAEAENVVARYGDEIAPETRAYVRASRVRAGRAMMLTAAAAVIFALVAVGALFQWSVAREQTALALRNFGVARDAVRGVVFDIVQGLGDVSGMRVDAIRRILSTAQSASDKLATTSPDDPELLRTRAAMFDNFSRMYATVGDLNAARTSADQAVDLLRGLVRTRPEDVRVEGDLSVPLVTRGNVASQSGDMRGARGFFEEALALARTGARRAPDDPTYRRRPASPLNRLGDLRLALGDYTGALAAYREQVELMRREAALVPKDREVRDGLWIAIFNLGFVGLESGDLALARRSYDEALAIAKALAEEAPESPGAQRSFAVMLSNLGTLDLEEDRQPEAMKRLEEALGIERRLLREDRENGERQRNLVIALEKYGNGAYAASDWPAALKAYSESLDLARDLVSRNPFDLRNQRSVTVALANVGFTRSQLGDQSGAHAAFEERLNLVRRLAEQQPDNAEAKRDLVIALRNFAQVKDAAREPSLALKREAAEIARPLAAIDSTYWMPLELLQQTLRALSNAQRLGGDLPGALKTLEEEVVISRRMLALRPGDRATRHALAPALILIGMLKGLADERPGSAAAFDEAIATFRSLAASGDTSAAAQIDPTLDEAGRIALMLGDRLRARDRWRDLVALRREQAGRRGSAASQQALAVALVKLAALEEDPSALLREAVALIDAVPDAERSEEATASRKEAAELLERVRVLSSQGSR